MTYLKINDTQAVIGEERLAINNPRPDLEPAWTPPPPPFNVPELVLLLEQRIIALEAQVALLQQRTFWSMLKDWVKSFWR